MPTVSSGQSLRISAGQTSNGVVVLGGGRLDGQRLFEFGLKLLVCGQCGLQLRAEIVEVRVWLLAGFGNIGWRGGGGNFFVSRLGGGHLGFECGNFFGEAIQAEVDDVGIPVGKFFLEQL